MTSWSSKTLAAVADLVGAMTEAPQGESRARGALEGISKLIPFDCALLCRVDGSSLSAVAAIGYGRSMAPVVARAEYRGEQKALGMDASVRPLRFRDLPDRGRGSFIVRELAWPAGLYDGMGMSIRSGQGRVVGHIALNAAGEGTFRDEHVALLALLSRPLSVAVADRTQASRSGAFGLTTRELQVLDLVAGGHTNGQIAETLAISQSTVRRHVEHLLMKLDVTSRTAAAVKASRHGLVG